MDNAKNPSKKPTVFHWIAGVENGDRFEANICLQRNSKLTKVAVESCELLNQGTGLPVRKNIYKNGINYNMKIILPTFPRVQWEWALP